MLKKFYYLCIVFSLLFSPFVFSQQDNHIVQGPFKANIFCNDHIYFERVADDSVNFILEYEDSGNKKVELVDNYGIEGGNPEIESVFFSPILKNENIFVIVSWEINSRGAGVYGKLYQVYAYEKSDKENTHLIKNMTLYNNRDLTGLEGISDWKESHFKYKTAAEVKKYIDKTYNKK